MHSDFFNELLSRQTSKENVPSNDVIAGWAGKLICFIYPELSSTSFSSKGELQQVFNALKSELIDMINATSSCADCNTPKVADQFFAQIPELLRILNTDITAIHSGDPAARSEFEVIRAYPGFYALCFFRIAHLLHELEVALIPRILTEYAHSKTGIDIHPAAEIGEYCCIDHGTGIVIGETAVIGNHVKLYQGVTLGALSVDKQLAYTKRHPTVEDHVIIYSGATILGGETVVGHHSIIGGNVWLTNSVPAGSLVFHNPEITVVENKIINY